jgi:Amidase
MANRKHATVGPECASTGMKAMPRKRASNRAGLRQLLLSATTTSALVWLVVSMGVMCITYPLLFSQPTVQTWISRFRRIGPQLIDATTEELINGLERGKFTSVDLVHAYITRIDEVNSTLRAVVEINPEAVAIAAALDAERAMGISRGPLHGLPYLLKNKIATKDKMKTTAGSYALLGAKVPRDATVVAKLRAAGVVILGKTNLSQWANFRSSMGSSSNG